MRPPGALTHGSTRSFVLHIVVMAWLYVTSLMALTFANRFAGTAFFLLVGLSPVLFYAWLATRRIRALRKQDLVLQQDVHRADDRHT
jgi:hypothetical protein